MREYRVLAHPQRACRALSPMGKEETFAKKSMLVRHTIVYVCMCVYLYIYMRVCVSVSCSGSPSIERD